MLVILSLEGLNAWVYARGRFTQIDSEEECFEMAEAAKVVVNLATGLEDAERVTIAFLVAGAAAERGNRVAMFLTKEAVRLAVPGFAEAVACEGCPPLGLLFQQFADNGGELLVCPICAKSRHVPDQLVGNAQLAGATPLWEWIGDEAVSVFSY
jgi:predicted peroxiredoxin